MRILLLTLVILFFQIAYTQTFNAQEVELQQKYFNLRDHFHKVHIFVGSGYNNYDFTKSKNDYFTVGTSIPYEKHKNDWLCPGQSGAGNYSSSDTLLYTGDGTIKIGWYLIYLASEYKLLNDAGKDTKEILNEIYYALNTIERLDDFPAPSFGT